MSVIDKVLARIESGKPPSNTKNQRRREVLDDFIIRLLQTTLKDVLPVSVRQIFYACVAANMVEKKEAHWIYDRVAFLRVEGRVSFDIVHDLSRGFDESYLNSEIEDANATLRNYIKSAQSPRLNRQTGQEIAQVVWTEATGTISQLEKVASPFDVPVVTGKGFASLGQSYYVAKDWLKLLDSLETNKLRVIYCGDYDPSGVGITHDVEKQLKYHFIFSHHRKDIDFTVDRVALNEDMIIKENILTQTIEEKTIKSAKSGLWHGVNGNKYESAQLEAIPPQRLQKIVRQEILNVYEASKFEPFEKEYEIECEKLQSIRDEILAKLS